MYDILRVGRYPRRFFLLGYKFLEEDITSTFRCRGSNKFS